MTDVASLAIAAVGAAADTTAAQLATVWNADRFNDGFVVGHGRDRRLPRGVQPKPRILALVKFDDGVVG